MLTPSASRILQALTLGALVCGVCFSFLRFNFLLALPLSGLFLLTALAALGLAVDAAWTKWRGESGKHIALAWIPLAFLLLAFVSPDVRAPLQWLGAVARLAPLDDEYLDEIARVEAGAEPREPLYLYETTPRSLYAFSWDGFADNWCGIVHDRAQEFASAPRNVFGGSLVQRIHLWGPWYYVEFT